MSFDGTWNLTINTPMGQQTVRLEITTTEGVVQGTASMAGDTAPFDDPVLEGDRLRWSMEITRPMRLTVAFDVTRDGDALQGKVKAGFLFSSDVTGVRAA